MPGLPAILFVVFLILKLTGYIAWSWVWVTAPLWIGLVLMIAVIGPIMIWWKLTNEKMKKGKW